LELAEKDLQRDPVLIKRRGERKIWK
jgi:hypothetical protein